MMEKGFKGFWLEIFTLSFKWSRFKRMLNKCLFYFKSKLESFLPSLHYEIEDSFGFVTFSNQLYFYNIKCLKLDSIALLFDCLLSWPLS